MDGQEKAVLRGEGHLLDILSQREGRETPGIPQLGTPRHRPDSRESERRVNERQS